MPAWLIGGVALGIVAVYLLRKIPGAASSVAAAVTPTNPNNLAYQGANSVVQTLTADPTQTLGGWIYDTFNPNAGLAPNETSPAPGMIVTSVPPSVPTLSGALPLPFSSPASTTSQDVADSIAAGMAAGG